MGAAILFVIWQLLGSQQSYEVSFRCAAYALAISPITAALDFIPYLGVVVGLAWMAYILVCASVEVHGTEPKICLDRLWRLSVPFLRSALFRCSTPREAFSIEWRELGKRLGEIEKMKPEEAGQAVGEFLKGMQKGMDKK